MYNFRLKKKKDYNQSSKNYFSEINQQRCRIALNSVINERILSRKNVLKFTNLNAITKEAEFYFLKMYKQELNRFIIK